MSSYLRMANLLEEAVVLLRKADAALSGLPKTAATPLMELDLSVRAENCLSGVISVEQVDRMSDDALLELRNMGVITLREIRDKICLWKVKRA